MNIYASGYFCRDNAGIDRAVASKHDVCIRYLKIWKNNNEKCRNTCKAYIKRIMTIYIIHSLMEIHRSFHLFFSNTQRSRLSEFITILKENEIRTNNV